jgi:hypothetical protein
MTWRKRTIMEMAKEAGLAIEPPSWGYTESYHFAGFKEDMERFAALVREEATAEANAKANASWTLMCEKMVAIEREACAKVADGYIGADPIAAAIRAREKV